MRLSAVAVLVTLALLLAVRARWWHAASVVNRVTTNERVVALTFDDGPLPPYTTEILTLLLRYHATATFFLLGREAERFPEVVRDLARAHMELALHGMTHLNLRRVGASFMVQDALKERALLIRLAPGTTAGLFRSPYGYRSAALEQRLAEAHLVFVLWDVDTRDWTRPGVSFIVRQVETLTKPGSIILFHDGGGNRSQTVDALKLLLPWFTRQGYQLVTVSQLITRAGT
jgi:peptidoglycan/xylan/chitin deacetylase (PgdA/CDA1 family)